MERTINGNGADELREQKEYLSDEYRKLRDKHLRARTVAEIADENDGIRRCVELEGEASFYNWWNDDALIPPMELRRVRIRMLEERIESLSRHVVEEIDHEGSVADEKADGEKSEEEAND